VYGIWARIWSNEWFSTMNTRTLLTGAVEAGPDEPVAWLFVDFELAGSDRPG
jgi:hypothetical protein